MIKLGLTGYPLGHSLSPAIHTAALQSCGLEGSYSLFPVQPNDKQGLKDLLQRVRDGDMAGLNVTIPHKQNVIEILDELTPAAQAIGAVNTIYMRDDTLIGENTDAPGFLSDLKKFLSTATPRHAGFNALVLGAGGSARAAVYALLNDGWTVCLCARRIEQAQQLADSLADHQCPITVYPLSNLQTTLQSSVSGLSLVVNTTPLGMAPNVDQSPWPDNLPLPLYTAIYDLVYNPRETKLVKAAHAQRLPATTGLGMLIEQAALAFELWTGNRLSRETLRASVEPTSISSLPSSFLNL